MADEKTIEEGGSGSLLREIARADDVPPPEPEVDLLGSSLGRFRVISLLGKGGMGVVYLAEDEALRREVALKVLAPDVAEDPDRRRRLLREARAAAAVSHPSIAAVYEVGEANGLLYIAMERVRGESLRGRIEKGAMKMEGALPMAKRILEGLAKAHEAGIVHRDLKPENVMVDDAGNVKILDFGLAKFLEVGVEQGNASTMLTEEGRLLGTPSYMSPEQAAGLPLDVRSDVFSFGIMFYEMVTGELPFQGANFLKLLAAIERDEPAPPSKKNPAVPAQIERVILRCLKKDPAERHANAREVLQDLEQEKPAVEPEPAPRPSRQWLPMMLVGVVLFVAGTAKLAGRMASEKEAPGPSPAASPQSSAMAAPVPTPITSLPLPKTNSPEALAAYREGLQAIRDGSWGNAYAAFKRSVELDPTLGVGHLRLALTGTFYAPTPDDARAAYRKAISFRDTLSERDMRLLEILSPILQQNPPDPAEAMKRLEAASRQYPGDAEFASLPLGDIFAPDMSPVRQLDTSTHCLDLDPRYADCWQTKGMALIRLGRATDALQAWQRCLEVSPAGNDCLSVRANVYSSLGSCAKADADNRLIQANDPDAWSTYRQLASSVLAQGRAPEAAHAVLEQGWAKLPASVRASARDSDEISMLDMTGQFEEAERRLLSWAKQEGASPFDGSHQVIASMFVRHHEVLGQTKAAGKAAADYLAGREAWTQWFILSIGTDATVWAKKRLLNAGSMSRDEFVAARAAFVEKWQKRLSQDMHGLVWLLSYATNVHTAADAKEALDVKPELKPLVYYVRNPGDFHSALGNVYLLAGKPAEAVPHLEEAVRDCRILLRPIEDTLDHYRLGMAKEALGDKKGACAAYKIVLDRWGKAKPRVPAAEDTRSRAKALGCEP